ncbi:MAG: hypothetical protein PHH75_04445 [Candidatus Omnitrophica bacterium]|nr:hypothetical protein [Candidatus Omnitrophota bacterium]MDD5574409.1 hypothetical protein [Candidatus Omnitrophota bacterium]
MAMGEKLEKFFSDFLPQNGAFFDPSVFHDPLAQATQWTPAAHGGANFCTHRFKKIDHTRVEFRPTFGMDVFCFFFILFGLFFAVLPLGSIYKQHGGFHWSMIPVPLFGVFFSAIGILILRYSHRPIVFDMKRGGFCKGWASLRTTRHRRGDVFVDMGRIRALQVLSEYCRGNKSSYRSYELNLVLDDASRVNVVDHGDLGALREDARALGQFLGVQVWDTQGAKGS